MPENFTPEELAKLIGSGSESWNLSADSAMSEPQSPAVPSNSQETSVQSNQQTAGTNTRAQGFNVGTNVVDLAEFSGLGNLGRRRLLRRNGFQYLDSSGNIVTVQGGSWNRSQMRQAAREAAERERAYRISGYAGDMTGWSNDAMALRRQQLGNDASYSTIAAPKPETRTYNYDFGSTFYGGDKSGYADITTGILKALYDNGKFDILDSMKGTDGKIGLEGLQKYHSSLGLDGINSGYFDEASINAMLSAGALTQAQADGFLTSARTLAPKPAGVVDGGAAPKGVGKWTPETIASASVDDLAAGVWRGEFGNGPARKTALGNRYNEVQARVNSMRPSNKQGGQIMKYFQAGGSVAAGKVAQENAQEASVQKQQQYEQLVANSQNFFEQLSKLPGEQANKLLEQIQSDAKSVPAAAELLSLIQQWMDRARVAKQGAKLSYIKRLRGECPEGYEPQKFLVGGKVCTKCAKIAAEKCGGKAKKHQDGGEAELVSEFKNKRKKK